MTKEEISALIAEKIKPNGKGEITAEVLAEVLDAMNNASQCYKMPSGMMDYFDGTARSIEEWEALGLDFTGIIRGKYSSIFLEDKSALVTLWYLDDVTVTFTEQMAPLANGPVYEYINLQFEDGGEGIEWYVTLWEKS